MHWDLLRLEGNNGENTSTEYIGAGPKLKLKLVSLNSQIETFVLAPANSGSFVWDFQKIHIILLVSGQ